MDMKLQDRYLWEAEREDGEVITTGGDLTGCVRFSLLPQHILLPRHDFAHVRMLNRFCRAFVKGLGGGMKEYVHCVIFETFRIYVSYSNGSVLITPKDFEYYI